MELNKKQCIFGLFITLILALCVINSFSISVHAEESPWDIEETFKLSLDSIEWTETQYNSEPGSFIQDGGWIEFYERGFLINARALTILRPIKT